MVNKGSRLRRNLVVNPPPSFARGPSPDYAAVPATKLHKRSNNAVSSRAPLISAISGSFLYQQGAVIE